MEFIFKAIAIIKNDFPTKFGIPRQSGLVEGLTSRIIFEQEYRNADALRGLDGYSHIWLIWQFSKALRESWLPTVRPPRLGGNTRMGVFATRSPFRPNPVGLSAVRLERIEYTSKEGPVLHISGADLMDGTPILDIKPYLAYVDSYPDASGGFALQSHEPLLQVILPDELKAKIPPEHLRALTGILAQDPRPAYQNDPKRVYKLPFAGIEVHFCVSGDRLTVTDILNVN